MLPRPLVLLTDFDARSFYPGVLHGVVARLLPEARVLDLTHGIAPGNIAEGAFALMAAWPYLPDDAVVVAVVDPGVGTERRVVALEGEGRIVVAPDNGVLTGLWSLGFRGVREVRRPDLELTPRSSTFHGRDVFAPLGAHLAGGLRWKELGPLITDPVLLDDWEPVVTDGTTRGRVLWVDPFGNLITNIRAGDVANSSRVSVRLGEHRFECLVRTYGDVASGAALAYVGSSGLLEIAVSGGRADHALGAGSGSPVDLVGEPRS